MGKEVGIVGYLEAGIKQETLRQSAIANNVANMNTPGYRRVDVKFNEVLAEKIAQGKDITDEDAQAELFEPRTTAMNEQGNDVSLDSEVGELVKNSLSHKVYMRLLAKKYQQVSLAIDTGR